MDVLISTDIHFETSVSFSSAAELKVCRFMPAYHTNKKKRIAGLEQQIMYSYSQRWGLTLEDYANV